MSEGGVALAAEADAQLDRHRRLDAGAVAEKHQERGDVGGRQIGLAAVDDLVAGGERDRARGVDANAADIAGDRDVEVAGRHPHAAQVEMRRSAQDGHRPAG